MANSVLEYAILNDNINLISGLSKADSKNTRKSLITILNNGYNNSEMIKFIINQLSMIDEKIYIYQYLVDSNNITLLKYIFSPIDDNEDYLRTLFYAAVRNNLKIMDLLLGLMDIPAQTIANEVIFQLKYNGLTDGIKKIVSMLIDKGFVSHLPPLENLTNTRDEYIISFIAYIVKETNLPTSKKVYFIEYFINLLNHRIPGLNFDKNIWTKLILAVYDPYYKFKNQLIQNSEYIKHFPLFNIYGDPLLSNLSFEEIIEKLEDNAAAEFAPGSTNSKLALDRLDLAAGNLNEIEFNSSYDVIIKEISKKLKHTSLIKLCSIVTQFKELIDLDDACENYKLKAIISVIKQLILILSKKDLYFILNILKPNSNL
jgi:hypothetical protein